MTPEQRWVDASPAEMLGVAIDFARGPMVADDVRQLPRSPLVLAEGTVVLPELVSLGFADRLRAAWLALPTDVQRARLEQRGTPAKVIEFYGLIAAEIDLQAREHGVTVVPGDGTESVDDLLSAVEELFAPAIVRGPRATSADERRALLRHANDEVVSQCRGYLARPWAGGDAESLVRAFVCECDDQECDEVVELAVAAFERAAAEGPVLSASHG
jgi:hypothetical protein